MNSLNLLNKKLDNVFTIIMNFITINFNMCVYKEYSTHVSKKPKIVDFINYKGSVVCNTNKTIQIKSY